MELDHGLAVVTHLAPGTTVAHLPALAMAILAYTRIGGSLSVPLSEQVRADLQYIMAPPEGIGADAAQYARDCSPDWLYNHVMRTFLFGVKLAEIDGCALDQDLFLSACVLHDIGLTAVSVDKGRFEADSADTAVQWLEARGSDPARSEEVWDAIALHGTIGVGDRHPNALVRYVYNGAYLDQGGRRASDLEDAFFADVFARLPRLGATEAGLRLLLEHIAGAPSRRAPPFSFQASFAQSRIDGFRSPSYLELTQQNHWATYE